MSDEKEERLDDFHISDLHEECHSVDHEGVAEMMRSMHGPQAVDQAFRQAVTVCWMMLPNDQKNVDALVREIRRLVDRIIADLREDSKAFGISETG